MNTTYPLLRSSQPPFNTMQRTFAPALLRTNQYVQRKGSIGFDLSSISTAEHLLQLFTEKRRELYAKRTATDERL